MKSIHTVQVMWSDCDPAEIVFFANYFRWMDEAAHVHLSKLGLGWHDLQHTYGTLGLPLVSAHADFKSPSRFTDVLTIETEVTECSTRTLTISHIFRIGDRIAAEGWTKRIWCKADPSKPSGMVAEPIPQDVKAILGFED